MKLGEILSEGKTKIIYENLEDPLTVYMQFKDDITAGDGVKHDVYDGKATLDWMTNRDIYEYLNRCGIKTHYISSHEQNIVLVKKLYRKINLEVVSRRVAAGSILQWGKVHEGRLYSPPITQFHYKDDSLHDPMIDQTYVDYLVDKKGASEYNTMIEMNKSIFWYLEAAFAKHHVQLIDIKLEYGIIKNNSKDGIIKNNTLDELVLIDEITGGSFRLWPWKTDDGPDYQKMNILQDLNPEERLDKDIYRMGGTENDVLSKFRTIAHMSSHFHQY